MSVPSLTPIPELQAAQNRADHVEVRRVKLSEQHHYLGRNTIWFPQGKSRILVDSGTIKETPEEEVTPAILSVIGRIDSQDLFVQCDGAFKGPTQFTKDIADVKLSLKFGKPLGDGAVVTDFNALIANLKALEKDVAVVGAGGSTSVIHNSKDCPGISLIKLRHVLFGKATMDSEPVANNENDPYRDPSPDAAGLATYTIENWPTWSMEAATALDKIKDTHIVNIPAFYDRNFMILEPKSYRKYLEGAVAEIRFTVTHHIIGKGSDVKNVFTADIVDIVIIHGGPPKIVTPKRPRVYAIHPSSPTKKRRS